MSTELELEEDHYHAYSVYSLTDGAVGETDFSVEDYAEAVQLYEAAVGYELLLAKKLGADYTETTVHLYDPVMGNMLMETCVTSQ